jgi:hypothetical protein
MIRMVPQPDVDHLDLPAIDRLTRKAWAALNDRQRAIGAGASERRWLGVKEADDRAILTWCALWSTQRIAPTVIVDEVDDGRCFLALDLTTLGSRLTADGHAAIRALFAALNRTQGERFWEIEPSHVTAVVPRARLGHAIQRTRELTRAYLEAAPKPCSRCGSASSKWSRIRLEYGPLCDLAPDPALVLCPGCAAAFARWAAQGDAGRAAEDQTEERAGEAGDGSDGILEAQ